MAEGKGWALISQENHLSVKVRSQVALSTWCREGVQSCLHLLARKKWLAEDDERFLLLFFCFLTKSTAAAVFSLLSFCCFPSGFSSLASSSSCLSSHSRPVSFNVDQARVWSEEVGKCVVVLVVATSCLARFGQWFTPFGAGDLSQITRFTFTFVLPAETCLGENQKTIRLYLWIRVSNRPDETTHKSE